MTERRRRARIPVEHLMEARLEVEGVASTGRVLDLNNAGAFVATNLDVEKDTEIQIELSVPGEEKSLPLKAVVARRSEAIEGRTRVIPAGLGIVFLADNVMERSFIQKAVLQALEVSLAATKRKAKPHASA